MRRRALLAAVSSNHNNELPPESTTFGFPLYLNVAYDEEYVDHYRPADALSNEFRSWLFANTVYDNLTEGMGHVPLTDETKIYINGGLVEEIIFDFGVHYMYGQTVPYDEVAVDMDGSIYAY